MIDQIQGPKHLNPCPIALHVPLHFPALRIEFLADPPLYNTLSELRAYER